MYVNLSVDFWRGCDVVTSNNVAFVFSYLIISKPFFFVLIIAIAELLDKVVDEVIIIIINVFMAYIMIVFTSIEC